MRKKNQQSGFTLMEIVVATVIFAVAVTIMLSLFNYTLKINRRVQGLRQVAQGTRNFTEFIAREVRNGEIEYGAVPDSVHCSGNYSSASNQSLALLNLAGEHLCFYYVPAEEALYMSKQTSSGLLAEKINPPYFKVKTPFQFIVRPTTDPSNGQGVQPFVTIVSLFEIQLASGDPAITIPYQSTISTDVYDTPSVR